MRLTSGRAYNRIGVEAWTPPDGTRIVELFAKCRPARSGKSAAMIRALIADHGITLSSRQATKTQMPLQRLTRPRGTTRLPERAVDG